MTPPVLFLDIDGVLSTHSTRYRYGDPLCVHELNRITVSTGALIVVSSTWRHDPQISAVLAGWGVLAKVIGRTPFLPSRIVNGLRTATPRGHEILKWIDNNHYNGAFVILDDEDDMQPCLHRLVQTDTYLGLTHKEADRAIEMLRRLEHCLN